VSEPDNTSTKLAHGFSSGRVVLGEVVAVVAVGGNRSGTSIINIRVALAGFRLVGSSLACRSPLCSAFCEVSSR
jgi:hypothetical protein